MVIISNANGQQARRSKSRSDRKEQRIIIGVRWMRQGSSQPPQALQLILLGDSRKEFSPQDLSHSDHVDQQTGASDFEHRPRERQLQSICSLVILFVTLS
jgi:hypothetical protein